jgi:hypothetical protein
VDVWAASEIYIFKYGQEDDDKIHWTILSDSQQVTECPMEAGEAVASRQDDPSTCYPFMKVDIPWKAKPEDVDYNSILFEHFFPSVKGEHLMQSGKLKATSTLLSHDFLFSSSQGKAKVLDEFLGQVSKNSLQSNPWKNEVEKHNIQFHCEVNEDPDELLKICLTLMVTATFEVHRGIANLWKDEPSSGMKSYPNYAKYIPMMYFKAFIHGFPYLWAERSVGMSTVVTYHLTS